MNDEFLAAKSRDGSVLWDTAVNGIGTSPPNTLNSTPASRRMARSPQTKVGTIGKKIEFPIFDRIAQLQTNDTWKRVFSDMATSKFPNKMIIKFDLGYSKDSLDLDAKVGTLIYKIRKTDKTLDIINDPVVMSEKLKSFIRDNAGITFDDSEGSDRDNVPVLYISEQKTHWNKLRSKDRESRIRIFAAKYAKDKMLSVEQTEGLLSELILANVCRDLTEDRVKLNDGGDIVQIIGLHMTDAGVFTIA